VAYSACGLRVKIGVGRSSLGQSRSGICRVLMRGEILKMRMRLGARDVIRRCAGVGMSMRVRVGSPVNKYRCRRAARKRDVDGEAIDGGRRW
jgi:hypothetical protein